jgi:hypothetical protein
LQLQNTAKFDPEDEDEDDGNEIGGGGVDREVLT